MDGNLKTRKLMDRYFNGIGVLSIALMTVALLLLLGPIFYNGLQAVFFYGTVEHRKAQFLEFGHGSEDALEKDLARAEKARAPLYAMLGTFRAELEEMPFARRNDYEGRLGEFVFHLQELFGPIPGENEPIMPRDQYGVTRWDKTRDRLHATLYIEEWDYSDPSKPGVQVYRPRVEDFEGTSLEPAFAYLEKNTEAMLLPEFTAYLHFFTDGNVDSHIFGGIWPEILGTIYLTIGSLLVAIPLGVIAAAYLVEYAGESRVVSFLRICISTLAGVPSIVFGLFGLAFFINTIHISESKSVVAGCLTLALLVLPTIIRASEEAFLAVPNTYREASLSLGASKWRTLCTVTLPAALPGILTGIVISMGRAAGETAPIIFTAAISFGSVPGLDEVFGHATPALPWNIYNITAEHEAADEIRHVQYGMVLTLVGLVLILNATAIYLRARIARKLRG